MKNENIKQFEDGKNIHYNKNMDTHQITNDTKEELFIFIKIDNTFKYSEDD